MTVELLAAPANSVPTACSFCDMDACICVELRAYVHAERRRLAVEGLHRGQVGDFQRAVAVFHDALALGAREEWVHEAAGLCALATGNISAARVSWEAAVELDASSPALGWLSSLKFGPIRSALHAYNGALKASIKGDYEAAQMELAKVLELLPDFMPGQQLSTILSRLDPHPVTELPSRATGHFRKPLRRFIGAVAAVGLISIGILLHGSGAAADEGRLSAPLASTGGKPSPVTPMRGGSPDSGIGSGATIAFVLGGNSDSLAAAIARVGKDTAAWSPAIRHRAVSLRTQVALRHFRRALRARARGLDVAALREFTSVVTLTDGTYLEDDALYELARTQARLGARDNAAETATRLLAAYPQSIYANSTIKALIADAAANVGN